MKVKNLLLGCFALAIGFTSCSKSEDGPGVDSTDPIDLFIKLDKIGARADTDKIENNTAVSFTEGVLYFTDNDGKIVRNVRITDTSGAGTLTAQQLEKGVVIEQVVSTATRVHVYGNFTPTKYYANINEIESVDLKSQKDDQNGVKNAGLYGAGPIEVVVGGGVHTDGTPYQYKASVEVRAIIARLEIEELSTKAGSKVESYTLEGIYINNYYYKVLPNGDKVPNSSDLEELLTNYYKDWTKYLREALGGEYKNDWYPFLYDDGGLKSLNETNKIGNSNASGSIKPTKDVWAYNVFAVAGSTPHIVFHFTDMMVDGSLFVNDVVGTNGVAYLTVTGYTHATDNGSVEFEGGNVYRMENVAFDEDDLGKTPEEKDKQDVLVEISLLPWKVIKVNPSFD